MSPEDAQLIDKTFSATASSESTKLKIALALLQQGFRPIPLGGYNEVPPDYFIQRKDGDISVATVAWPKTPRVKWAKYQTQSPTVEELTRWWTEWPNANIAILTGNEVYVVDADSESAMEWVEANLPTTPWRVDTAKGRHYYYAVAPGSEIKNSVDAKAKIDIRGKGGYIVAAGSIHHTGNPYKWNMLDHPVADTYTDLPELSAEMIVTISAYNGDDTSDIDTNSGSIVAPRNYKAPPGQMVKEGERNNEATRFAGSEYRRLSKEGIEGCSALAKVTEALCQWNEGLDTPLTDFELANVAQSVQKTAERKRQEQSANVKTESTWLEPAPLIKPVPAVDFPLEALPSIIKDAVMEVYEYVQAPVTLVVQSALTALSTASQAHYDVARDEVLIGSIGLYMLALGESGVRKTSCDSFFTGSIKEFEKSEHKRLNPLVETYKAEYGAWIKQIQGIEGKIKQVSAKGDCVEDLQNRLVELYAKQPRYPKMQRLIYKDSTPEALLHNLSKWPVGVLTSSEGGSVFGAHGMNKDSAGNYLTKLNELWDGETMQIDRRQEGSSFSVQDPRFSLGIMVQPKVLMDFIGKAGHMARENGFFARCLITCNDDSKFGRRPYQEPPASMPHLQKFNSMMDGVLNTWVDMESEVLDPRLLRLSVGAKKIWVQYANFVEHELRRGGEFENIKDVASKSAENAARLAAQFEIATANGFLTHEVSTESMDRAVKVAGWYVYEASRFFEEVAIPQVLQDAKMIEKWLIGRMKDTGQKWVPRREIRQYGPNSLRDKDRIDKALSELMYAYRVREFEGKQTTYIEVNPALLNGDER